MLNEQTKQKLMEMINEELPRVNYGSVYIELIIQDGKVERITTDTRKSMKIFTK